MQAYASGNSTSFDLWRLNDVMDGPPRFETPLNLLTIKPRLEEAEFGAAFNSVVVKKPGADDLPNANSLATLLSTQPFPGGHIGLGRVVAALHAYSAVSPSHIATSTV